MHDDPGEPLPILIRAFSTAMLSADDDVSADPVACDRQKVKRRVPAIGPANAYLVFDTETTVDAAMRCRLGFYQLHREDGGTEEGLFYEPREVYPGDTGVIHAYATERGLAPPITLDQFRELFRKCFHAGVQTVGLNLPFDLSRIAIGSDTAKAGKWNKKMRGAHSLRFWDSDYEPRIQIKHLNPRLSLIGYTAPNPGASRSTRRRGDIVAADRGTFIDIRTLASAILSGSFSLERLTQVLKTPTQKVGTSEHGKPLTFDYLDYARADVQATWECFCALRERYAGFGLSTPLRSILSEAGIGKAMLGDMGIAIAADADPGKIARSFHSYYGGRTEVRIRRQITRVVQTDFMAMYPTVCTLMGLWRFVIASSVIERDTTDETRALLASTTPGDWQAQSAWRGLTTLVRVQAGADMFPVRSYYQGEQHASIGLNRLTCKTPLWFTLADCLAAKFVSGKTPQILEAVSFEPGPPQADLRPISLLGRLTIDPYKHDPFRELVVIREKERLRAASLPEAEQGQIEEFRQLLKIMVNSTSYGIFVQVNVQDEDRKVWRMVHVHGEEPFSALIAKSEEPGPYFHPLLGTLITGAARLMLALAQCRAGEEGLGWAFCDTDSIALAKPDVMEAGDFLARASRVSQWFSPLNPYGFEKTILKVEDINFVPDTREHLPLFCYAVSSKRYALFNIDADQVLIIRKASAHGLGHFIAPYDDDDGAPGIPPPLPKLKAGKDRLTRWQYDAWYTIVAHELSGTPGRVRFDYHAALREPAVSRFGATSPAMLAWMQSINAGLSYADRVKPFGLLYGLHAKKRSFDFTGVRGLTGDAAQELHPVAPFHPELKVAVAQAFDRVTGRPIGRDECQLYADALAAYPYKQESKFRNGEAFQRGVTEPRHVIASDIHFIGKEADRWEEDFLIGIGFEPMTKFGRSPYEAAAIYTEIREAARAHGEKPVADATGLPRGSIAKIVAGTSVRTKLSHDSIRNSLLRLMIGRRRRDREWQDRLERYEHTVASEGSVAAAARKLCMDPSNLAKALRQSYRTGRKSHKRRHQTNLP